LERPMKANSGSVGGGHSLSVGALDKNVAWLIFTATTMQQKVAMTTISCTAR